MTVSFSVLVQSTRRDIRHLRSSEINLIVLIFIDSQLADSAILIYYFCWYVCLSVENWYCVDTVLRIIKLSTIWYGTVIPVI